jgi:hypothetical protein
MTPSEPIGAKTLVIEPAPSRLSVTPLLKVSFTTIPALPRVFPARLKNTSLKRKPGSAETL